DLDFLALYLRLDEGRAVLEIATSFYKKQPVVNDNGVPAMLASLITSNKADVLATAYEPAAPDYSRQSPFDSILADQDS
ncbi:hypothetical protein ACC738_38855, partial [Rhizobium ruizarguesonis]